MVGRREVDVAMQFRFDQIEEFRKRIWKGLRR